jgi:FtsZ-binding cell division protein ZapB
MPDKCEEILKQAQDTLTNAKAAHRRELETLITQPLTPEAREDAMKVTKEIWQESMRLLNGKTK